jgi:periplasmic divalent cation tolerance protein
MNNITLVYITCPDEETAVSISNQMIKEKLIACANIHQIRSIYPWMDEIIDDSEYVILAKTKETKLDEIKARVGEMHPYEIPCILNFSVAANEKYANWISACLD